MASRPRSPENLFERTDFRCTTSSLLAGKQLFLPGIVHLYELFHILAHFKEVESQTKITFDLDR